MTKELDEKLCADFPEIFRDRRGGMRTTAMCWGFECGDGWFTLIYNLCKYLSHELRYAQRSLADWTPHIENPPEWCLKYEKYSTKELRQQYVNELQEKVEKEAQKIPVATQVKEKFGTLRFYYHGGTPETDAVVSFAEMLSGSICDECGDKGELRTIRGWDSTLCDTHFLEKNG
jgi:hypothetical protein